MTHAERAERRAKVAEYCRTHSVRDAAQHFGVTPPYVYDACATAGVECLREPSARKAGRVLDIVAALVNTAQPYATIAERKGVTRQAVHAIVTRCVAAGIKVKVRA